MKMAIQRLERSFPPLFTELHGKVKSLEFRTRRNGLIEISARRKPKQPETEKQKAVKRAYGRIYQMWTQLSDEEKEYYNQLGKKEGLSGWNVFFREKMKGETFEIVLDATYINETLTDYVLFLFVADNQDLYNAMNDELTNIKVLDEDKTTELQFFRFTTKKESNDPLLLIKIPQIQANSYKKIYIMCKFTIENYGEAGENFFEFFDDFNDPTLSNWNVSDDAIAEVSNSKLLLKSESYKAGLTSKTEYDDTYQVIAKLTRLTLNDNYAALGFSQNIEDLYSPSRYSHRLTYFESNKTYAYAYNVETEDICSIDYASLPSQYPTLLRTVKCTHFMKSQLNRDSRTISNQSCVNDEYTHNIAIHVYKETSQSSEIELDFVAVAKAYPTEPSIYLIRKI
ncbi:MAG: hypothetical protein DRN30_01115 [Thermoplasmata archaeon]|nr:MAG: hypothetical protein DRN30_01115 [Thermoplasmata archaeon]